MINPWLISEQFESVNCTVAVWTGESPTATFPGIRAAARYANAALLGGSIVEIIIDHANGCAIIIRDDDLIALLEYAAFN
ncbi:hypothetical protein AB4099_08585 [Bosea sp. 2KB_26]|uniref:hypothetical protein n=1 Tax=Bosea sp. 2KB_26 TaxID=3237475 RepID=UPI0013B02140